MAKYKKYDYNQMMMVPVALKDQLMEGTMEYAINEVVDNKLNLEHFAQKYHNDNTGRPAYDPRIDITESCIIGLLTWYNRFAAHREIMPGEYYVHGINLRTGPGSQYDRAFYNINEKGSNSYISQYIIIL